MDRGWLGQTEDTDTGLTYLNARYYDPALGRFLSPDPLMDPGNPKTLDPYRYADNNPTTFTDPSGLNPNCPSVPTTSAWYDVESFSVCYTRYADQHNPFWRVERENREIEGYQVYIGDKPVSEGELVLYLAGLGAIWDGAAGCSALTGMVATAACVGAASAVGAGLMYHAATPADQRNAEGYALAIGTGGMFGFGGGALGGVASAGARAALPVVNSKMSAWLSQSRSVTRDPLPQHPTISLYPPDASYVLAQGIGRQGSSITNQVTYLGNTNGCWSCGAKTPGSKSGNWFNDHWPPTALQRYFAPGTPQRIYPQCASCSNSQGGVISAFLKNQQTSSRAAISPASGSSAQGYWSWREGK